MSSTNRVLSTVAVLSVLRRTIDSGCGVTAQPRPANATCRHPAIVTAAALQNTLTRPLCQRSLRRMPVQAFAHVRCRMPCRVRADAHWCKRCSGETPPPLPLPADAWCKRTTYRFDTRERPTESHARALACGRCVLHSLSASLRAAACDAFHAIYNVARAIHVTSSIAYIRKCSMLRTRGVDGMQWHAAFTAGGDPAAR